jgi:signal transduction histidine kinase
VEIENDGVGFSEEDEFRVFEPFFTTKDVGQGAGLGLDAARRSVMESFGGDITFTSKPGLIVFRVVIPLSPPAQTSG